MTPPTSSPMLPPNPTSRLKPPLSLAPNLSPSVPDALPRQRPSQRSAALALVHQSPLGARPRLASSGGFCKAPAGLTQRSPRPPAAAGLLPGASPNFPIVCFKRLPRLSRRPSQRSAALHFGPAKAHSPSAQPIAAPDPIRPLRPSGCSIQRQRYLPSDGTSDHYRSFAPSLLSLVPNQTTTAQGVTLRLRYADPTAVRRQLPVDLSTPTTSSYKKLPILK